MPYIPVPGVSQVEQIFEYNGQRIEMVHHYSNQAEPLQAHWEAMHVLMRTDWSNTLIAVLAPTLVWVETKFTDLSTQTGQTYTTSTSLPFPGASASAQLPNNCALVITKRTALRGRSFRGRSYMPGLTEAVVTGNSVLSTFLTPALNFFNAALSYAVTGNEFNMVVVSRFSEGAPRITGISTPVTNFTADTVVDSQRRRLPLRGA